MKKSTYEEAAQYSKAGCSESLLFAFAILTILLFNPIALRMAKTLWSFGHSECIRFEFS